MIFKACTPSKKLPCKRLDILHKSKVCSQGGWFQNYLHEIISENLNSKQRVKILISIKSSSKLSKLNGSLYKTTKNTIKW